MGAEIENESGKDAITIQLQLLCVSINETFCALKQRVVSESYQPWLWFNGSIEKVNNRSGMKVAPEIKERWENRSNALDVTEYDIIFEDSDAVDINADSDVFLVLEQCMTSASF